MNRSELKENGCAELEDNIEFLQRWEQDIREAYGRNSVDADQLKSAAAEIARLKAENDKLRTALRTINRIIDHPSRFNSEIQEVLDAVIDTSDVVFGEKSDG